jgi:hypothetical protein
MIWLAFRRHRTNLAIACGLTAALVVWMVLVAHWYDTAPTTAYRMADGAVGHYRDLYQGAAIFRLVYQAKAVNLVLLAFPCLLGVILGVPLVAAELDDRTNRLAWTQQISRTRWLSTKWWVVGTPLVVLSAVVVVAAQWWLHHVGDTGLSANIGSELSGGASDRMQPEEFSVTGVVPLAYTVFAFALGTSLGALLRRVTWSIFATLLLYTVASLVMVTMVRPDLAPRTFVPIESSGSGVSYVPLTSLAADGAPWYLGSGYRFVPGTHVSAGTSAAAAGGTCESLAASSPGIDYSTCLSRHHLQEGMVYQSAANYWTLQWRESLIYLGAAALLLLASLVLVRRWRA